MSKKSRAAAVARARLGDSGAPVGVPRENPARRPPATPAKETRPGSMVSRETAMCKVLEVAAFVRGKVAHLTRLRGGDLDDVYQTAALAALEDWCRYGNKYRGNPFARMSAVAFAETKLAMARASRAVSISEWAATGRVKGAVPPPGWQLLYADRGGHFMTNGKTHREERFADGAAVAA